MGKKFIIEGAPCLCKFGSVPARLKVISHQLMVVNHGDKKIVTSMELGYPFDPPAFGVCRSSWPPRPCSPAVIQWDNTYKGMRINSLSNPLLPESKATCAVSGAPCIEIINHGQIELPGLLHMKNRTAEHQTEMDPTGGIEDEPDIITIEIV